MTANPLVSIITVVFNGEEHLQQTIDSVKHQTYDNIEYIIVDGGSTDKTLDIVRQNESHISKWISEPDDGLYDAMNKGIQMANGILIGIVNSDDWYEKTTVQLVIDSFIKNPDKRIFHGDKNCINSDGSIIVKKAKNNPFLIKYYAMVLNHPTMFVHKEVYASYLYNTTLKSLSDYQFTLTNYLKDRNQFQYIPKVLSNFRLGGISGQLNIKNILKENYIARKNAGMGFIARVFALLFRLGVIFTFKITGKKK